MDQHGYFVLAKLQRHNLKLAKMKCNRIVSQESIYVFFKDKPKQTLKHSIKLGCKGIFVEKSAKPILSISWVYASNLTQLNRKIKMYGVNLNLNQQIFLAYRIIFHSKFNLELIYYIKLG